MAYTGNIPVPQATQTRDRFTATAGQTSFATAGYTPGFLDVYLNGVHLDASDYTATNGSDVVLASGAAAGDLVEIVAFTAFTPADLDPTNVSDKVNNSTGFFALPKGTTAQRPASPEAGNTRFNASLNRMEYWDGYNWLGMDEVSGYITSATGGTVTTDGDYKVHTFTSSGTFTISTLIGSPQVEYLIVAGGGSGGYLYGGGGGAGGVLIGTKTFTTTGSHTITVGGGAAINTNGLSGSPSGSKSTAFSLVAVGGGGGVTGYTSAGATAAYARNGGSGGGGGNVSSAALQLVTAKFGGKGISGQGNDGGHSSWWGSSDWGGGGGGGGAGEPGDNARQGSGPVGGGGFGGDGIVSDITGSSIYYGGGGGGGGSNRPISAVAQGSREDGAGGYGGGGRGGSETLAAVNGTPNTGGGGGGGGSSAGSYTSGGTGGSGVVIVRYRFQ